MSAHARVREPHTLVRFGVIERVNGNTESSLCKQTSVNEGRRKNESCRVNDKIGKTEELARQAPVPEFSASACETE